MPCGLRRILLLLHDEGLGGEQHGRDEVDVLAGHRVQSVSGREVGNLGDDDIALLPSVLGDPAKRLGCGATHDGHARRLVAGQPEATLEDQLAALRALFNGARRLPGEPKAGAP